MFLYYFFVNSCNFLEPIVFLLQTCVQKINPDVFVWLLCNQTKQMALKCYAQTIAE